MSTNGNCKLCGTEGRLEKHHLIPRSVGGNNESENVVYLCSFCHRIVHSSLARGNANFISVSAPAAKLYYERGTSQERLSLSLKRLAELVIGECDPLLARFLQVEEEKTNLQNNLKEILTDIKELLETHKDKFSGKGRRE